MNIGRFGGVIGSILCGLISFGDGFRIGINDCLDNGIDNIGISIWYDIDVWGFRFGGFNVNGMDG